MTKNYAKNNYLKTLLLSVLAGAMSLSLFAQGTANPTYATTATPVTDGGTIVDNNGGAIAALHNGNTVITTGYNGFFAGTGTSTPTYTLNFAAAVPANTTTFVKVSSNTVGNITLTALNAGGSTVASTVTLAFDPMGGQYLAITSAVAYQSVVVSGLSATYVTTVGITQTVTVYYALYYPTFTTTAVADCGPAVYTLPTSNVVNPSQAINANTSDYSAFTVFLVGAQYTQTVLFNGPSNAGDNIRITLENPLSLSVSLLNNITVQAYNGTAAVGTPRTVSYLLNLLNLFNLSGPQTTIFTPGPGIVFDRVTITASGINVGAGDILRIYDVLRIPASPSILDNSACNLANATDKVVSVTSTQASVTGFTYKWYATTATSGTPAFTSTSASPNVNVSSLPTGTYTYYVSATKTSCAAEDSSAFAPVTFSVTNSCAILPAIGLNLVGSLNNSKPVLTWTTLQEQNTSYYSVEASPDGINFTSIGKVSAAGNSSSLSSYAFTDNTSIGSLVYYRVKLVDIDGNVSYSNVFSLRLSGSAFAKVYPNPVTNLVNIETGAPCSYATELFTIDGKKVISAQLSTASGLVTFNIDRTNVPSGVYLLKLTSKSNSTSTYTTIMIK